MKKTGIWQKWLQPTQFGDTILVISLKVVNLNLKDWRKLWKKNQNEKKWSIEGAWPIRRNMLLWILSLLDAAFQQIPWEYIWELCWNSMRIPWRIPLRIPFRIHLGILLKIPLRNPLWILPLVNTPQQPLSINQCILAV